MQSNGIVTAAELKTAHRLIQEKDDEIAELRGKIMRLESLLDQRELWNDVPTKKEGISAKIVTETELTFATTHKSTEDTSFILEALTNNDFFSNLDVSLLHRLAPYMCSRQFSKSSLIIREGDSGSELFILKSGKLQVLDSTGRLISHLYPKSVFGELAILYNCARTATVQCDEDSEVFVLDQSVYKSVMISEHKTITSARLQFLCSVPLFKGVKHHKLVTISDSLEQEFYRHGDSIVCQGERGSHFYIVASGRVGVIQETAGVVNYIRELGKGDFFGEQALLGNLGRSASVIALTEVECLVLDRENLLKYIGDLQMLKTKTYDEKPQTEEYLPEKPSELHNLTVENLKVVETLGIGGFGRVELVHLMGDPSRTYALKSLSKHYIVNSHQEQHIIQEKDILFVCQSPYIVQLFSTFSDSRCVYFLMEVMLGGELWTILRNKKRFSEDTARFCLGCVVEGIDYLHSRGIVYRDMKPENLLIDKNGYIKMTDFGFAKMIGRGNKTWTFCGTPEYVAPEVILNKGHDFAFDYWSLGILLFELLTGRPPFVGNEPLFVYHKILKGIAAVKFPGYVGKHSRNFILAACKPSPLERLGYGRNRVYDIRIHRLFHNFEWPKLASRQLQSDLVPTIDSPIDTKNFDKYPPSSTLPPEEYSGWDKDF